MKIRLLTNNEVECRVQQVTATGGAILLLYKDARVDMRILDETFGAMNWQRHHNRDNANCIISVWDKEKEQWISKEDTGKESNTEQEKGLASDSFKRAGFNWGIGRELYDAPFIFIKLNETEIKQGKNGKPMTYTRFSVKDMHYNEETREFDKLIIVDERGKERFILGKKIATPPTEKTPTITSVSESGMVRFIDGVQCQIKSKNGHWYNVEAMPIITLEKLMNDDNFANAHEAIRATINAKAVAAK